MKQTTSRGLKILDDGDSCPSAGSKTLYRFAGNSGRNLLTDRHTAVGGGGQEVEVRMDGVQCRTANCTPAH